MPNTFTIARIYAKAIFDISIQENTVNQWKSILKIFSIISQDRSIQLLCCNLLNPKTTASILIAIYQDYKKEQLYNDACRFIKILTNNNRVLLLPKILTIFNDLHRIYKKSIQIELISARELNQNQLKKITEIMTHRLSKTINIVCHLNKNILAGIIIRIGDTIIDGSLKGRLLRLNNTLNFLILVSIGVI